MYASCITNEGERTKEAFLAKEKLLKMVNASVAGPWTSDILPTVYYLRVNQISKSKSFKQVLIQMTMGSFILVWKMNLH